MKTPDSWTPYTLNNYFSEVFHACGCSELDTMVDTVKHVLEWYKESPDTRIEYTELYKEVGVFYIIAGLFADNELIEHGVSLRVGWISEKGYHLLEALKTYTSDEIENAN